ncbi:hypothetical protein KQY27_08815 [Methanobrevibacter sp. TMH8]|uniref:hypothetical protein n=1 Tax=Methanobrevibacter sp. TMH8 TaxID=2848611 RepID=UPI001CCDC3D5|nr:hypothetical protein [Methanobrevibacter sp. TMH8]MBZ9571645.1 hypothetical protein [Methanobrevibacter sp. TMH8]
MNINKTKIGIFAILIAFLIICSVSTVSAAMNINNGKVTINNDLDNAANNYAGLGGSGNIFAIEKSKIPKSIKKHAQNTFQVAKGKKVRYKGATKSGMAVEGVKIKSSYINFGDGTKKRSSGWISHAYKNSGWKKITVTFNATFTKFNIGGLGTYSGKIQDATAIYYVYVANRPQLVLNAVKAGYSNYRDYKRGNINFLKVKVSNVGSLSTKATKIKIWYQYPKKFGKVHPKLKKYTATAKIKALRSGQSAIITIYFKIPKKLAKYVKNIRLDSLNRNKNQIYRANNLYSLT